MDAARIIERNWLLFAGYAVTLLTASARAFGIPGIALGSLIAVVWGYIFLDSRRSARIGCAVAVIILGAFVLLMLPAGQLAREAARRTQCRSNPKQIGLALHNYHDAHDSFPPPYTVDAQGRPLHSWRVLILEYLGREHLYEQFRLDEPWDSPHNLEVAKQTPEVYECPSREFEPGDLKGSTSYVAVVGDGTVWPGAGQSSRIGDIADGTSNTILFVESNSGILWNEPRDLSLDEALGQLADAQPIDACGHRARSFFYDYSYGRHAALADGSVCFIRHGVDRDTWSNLLRINDGAPLRGGWDNLRNRRIEVPRSEVPRYGNWIRLAVFVLVALFPLPWVWRNRNSGRDVLADPSASHTLNE